VRKKPGNTWLADLKARIRARPWPVWRGRLPGTGAAGYHCGVNGAATLSPAPECCALSASNDVTQDGCNEGPKKSNKRRGTALA
jgi:hypothetical protein